MTTAPERRPLLPLFPATRHGSRSFMTCEYRCGNACDHPVPNRSENEHIQDVIAGALRRRAVVKGLAVGTGALAVGGLGVLSPAAAAPGGNGKGAGKGKGRPGQGARGDLGRVAFEPVAPNNDDRVTVPEGFTSDVVMRWGDPVEKDAPRFDVRRQSAAAARKQFGYNCDYVGVIPLSSGRGRGAGKRALLVVNHEYTNEELMFPTGAYSDDEIREIAMASHGLSVVEIEQGEKPGSWRQVPVRRTHHNRRIHVGTEFVVDGPAAGDARLRTSADPTGRKVLGTLNNCAGGSTPWGTVLSGEENFNQYFELPAGASLDPRYAQMYARYGITGGAGRGWRHVDPRFDLAAEPHEPHRFGWVVEVDPLEPDARPVKHTMLGRFKHEGANIAIARDGRAVAYMGDDERGDYIYKFVSRDKYDPRPGARARRHNKTLLSAGTLYVAKFTGDGSADGEYDGTGSWIPLCTETRSYVPGMSVADVLIFTRAAADKVGPTKMDRPEDVEPNLVNGKVYAALTNNSNRGRDYPTDEANPVGSSMVRASLDAPLTRASGNRNGYVLEMTPRGGDHTRDTFTWALLLVCGDPEAAETYFGGYDKSAVSPISCPDNVTFDSHGNLWVSTDGNVLGSHDGLFRVPTSGPERGKVEQFLTMPIGAETCGPLVTNDNRSLFFAVQHPGESDGATFENQASTWPHTDAFPRPSVGVAYQA